jgi:hypothetical protein
VPHGLGLDRHFGLHDGGLNLDASHGEYRAAVEQAIQRIAGARLPNGTKPVLTGDLEFVRSVSNVRTSVLYGRLPWENPTAGYHDEHGRLTHVDIRLTDLVYIGTKARKAKPESGGHAAVAAHPEIPATYRDGSPRVFEMTLAHEVGHAARIIRGQALPDFMAEEYLITNLENQYRFARGIAQRTFYGDMRVKQSPW